MLTKILQTLSKNQADSEANVQELPQKDITYEELEILLGRNEKTRHLSDNLREKLGQSEFMNESHNQNRYS